MNTFKILLVEDDQLMMRVFEKQFKLNGLEVDMITDGDAAIAYLNAATVIPSLVCLDIMLPKTNGVEVLKFIRSYERTKDMPVIILSNVSSKEASDEVKKLGVQGFFLKSEHEPQEIGDEVVKIITAHMNQ